MTESKYANRPLYPRFVAALFTGNPISLPSPNPIGSLKDWPKDGLSHVIDIAKAQLDAQMASLDRTLSRAQLLFTTLLGLNALLFGLAPQAWTAKSDLWSEWVPRALMIASEVFFILALLGTAALIAVRKLYDGMNAEVISRWEEFDVERVAREYAECVGIGEATTDAHLTVFGTAVRLTLYGSVLLAASWTVGQVWV